MEDPFSKIESNSFVLTKKSLFGLYAASVFITVAGIICVYDQLDNIPFDTARLLVGIAITLSGIAFGLCVYFRNMIPVRAKFYLMCLAFTVGGICMAVNPRGSYRHSPENIRFVGVAGALLFGAGGLLVLYRDLKFHYDHRNELGEDSDEETISDGVIRFNTSDEAEVMEAFGRFDFQNSQREFLKPRVIRRGLNSFLVLHDIEYSDFCFLFNWLVYRMIPVSDYSLRGWLEEPHLKVKDNAITGPIMLYIPSDDMERDNVYFVAPRGNYYKQEFANAQRLHEVIDHAVPYEPCPEV